MWPYGRHFQLHGQFWIHRIALGIAIFSYHLQITKMVVISSFKTKVKMQTLKDVHVP